MVQISVSVIHARLMSQTSPISNLQSTFYAPALALLLQQVGMNWPHRQPWALRRKFFPCHCFSPRTNSRTLRNPSSAVLVALKKGFELTKIWAINKKGKNHPLQNILVLHPDLDKNLPVEALRKSERLHVGVCEQIISSKSSPFCSVANANCSAWTSFAKCDPFGSVAQD